MARDVVFRGIKRKHISPTAPWSIALQTTSFTIECLVGNGQCFYYKDDRFAEDCKIDVLRRQLQREKFATVAMFFPKSDTGFETLLLIFLEIIAAIFLKLP